MFFYNRIKKYKEHKGGLYMDGRGEDKKSGGKKKHGLLGVLESAGLVEVGAEEEATETKSPVSVPRASPVVGQSKDDQDEDYEKFKKSFLNSLTNEPGSNFYFEFQEMMKNLESAVPDEKTRIAASMAALKQDKNAFSGVVDKLLKVLTKENSSAVESLNAKGNSAVESLKKEKVTIDNQIKTAEDQLTKLRGQSKEIDGKLASAQNMISQVLGNANKAHDDICKELTMIKDKINQYCQ
jgi:hypothetical protein